MRGLWTLLLAGCSAGGGDVPAAAGWTEAAAIAPTLARLDRDGDGRVRAPEVDATAYAGGDLARMDTDGNARLSADELLAWMAQADPLTFDQEPGRPPIPPAEAVPLAATRRVALLEELLMFLAAEVRAAAPEAPVPTPYHIQQAAQHGDLTHPEVQAVLQTLAAGYAQAGRSFPAALRPLLSAEVSP